eukprot:SAG31_NODE_316_length_17841_cov_33.716154_10_plen_84_part_00
MRHAEIVPRSCRDRAHACSQVEVYIHTDYMPMQVKIHFKHVRLNELKKFNTRAGGSGKFITYQVTTTATASLCHWIVLVGKRG